METELGLPSLWMCVQPPQLVASCFSSPPHKFVSRIPENFLQKLFLRKEKKKKIFNTTEDGLDPGGRRKEHEPSHPSAPLQMCEQAGCVSRRAEEREIQGFYPKFWTPWHLWHGPAQPWIWSHSLPRCWALAEFSLSHRLPSFPFWLPPSPFL